MARWWSAVIVTVIHTRIVVEVVCLYTIILITLKRALFVLKIKLVGNKNAYNVNVT